MSSICTYTVGIIMAAAMIASPICADARTWHVYVDGSGDAPGIQAAIDSSHAADSIVVGPGTYTQAPIHCFTDSITICSIEGPANTVLRTLGYGVLSISRADGVAVMGFTMEDTPSHGVWVEYSSGAVISMNIFRGSSGSAVVLYNAHLCRIESNLIHSNAYGIRCREMCSFIQFVGNTIFHTTSGAGIDLDVDALGCSVENNIVANNNLGVVAGTASFLCNDVYGNVINYDLFVGPDPTGVDGNISADPLFCGVEPVVSGNFLLRSDSPCAPGNHPDGNSCGLIGVSGVGCGNTASEQSSWGRIKSIFR